MTSLQLFTQTFTLGTLYHYHILTSSQIQMRVSQKAKATVHHRRKQSVGGIAAAVAAGESDDAGSSTTPRNETLDAYGFEISVTAEQEEDLARCAAHETKQLAKWQEFCVPGTTMPPEDRLKRLCRKGIPPQLRKWVWTEVSGAGARRTAKGPGYYATAVDLGRRTSPFVHQIQLDVPRTFPTSAWVQTDAGQAALRRLLFAFAHHNPIIGYCQGMNYVAAILLVVMGHDEEAAFWVLASLIDDDRGILYQDMYSKDLSGCHVEMRSLKELVTIKLPRLGAHMEALRCDISILATDWFLCLFCTSLPAETAIRMWDALLNEGTKVLFRVGLALLKMHEPVLLATDNPGELLRAARNAAAVEFDRDELMRVAFDGVGSLPMEKIRRFRHTIQRRVDQEMAAREMRANLRQAVKQGYVLTEAERGLLRGESSGEDLWEEEDGGSNKGWKRLGSWSTIGEKTKATLEAGKQRIKQLPKTLPKQLSNNKDREAAA